MMIFDFFSFLPNQLAPCRPFKTECTLLEYNQMIHKFLLIFWDSGFCIRHFNPNINHFRANGKMMWSMQLRKNNKSRTINCFNEKRLFGHMHLGLINRDGFLQTNIWVPPHSHPKDHLPLSVILPITTCKMGPINVPCPKNIVRYLSIRNQQEYIKGKDGNCLLVKSKWSTKKKKETALITTKLHHCGYNSMIKLHNSLLQSNYTTCNT